MSRLIRMDASGHSTLAEWTAADPDAHAAATRAFEHELSRGYLGIATYPDGSAEQIHTLALDGPSVILRRPIAGG